MPGLTAQGHFLQLPGKTNVLMDSPSAVPTILPWEKMDGAGQVRPWQRTMLHLRSSSAAATSSAY